MELVFKRYIHRHGKKHGPYYYHNVKDSEGRVKSIYIGKTHPSQQPRKKRPVLKMLYFSFLTLILIAVALGAFLFVQNQYSAAEEIPASKEAALEVDQLLMKILIREGEFITKSLRVMNSGSDFTNVEAGTIGLPDIVTISEPFFGLRPGQTKVLDLTLGSTITDKKIEQQPGVYTGKITLQAGEAAKEIPLIVEIESKLVLFDMNLNPLARDRRMEQGQNAVVEVRLFNLEGLDAVNVQMSYFIKDLNGNTLTTESESVVVKSQASFFKTIEAPHNLKPGNYVFVSQAEFAGSIGTASYLFEITAPEKTGISLGLIGFCRNDPICWSLSLIVILLLFSVGAYIYFFIGAYIYRKIGERFQEWSGTPTLPKAVPIEKVSKPSWFRRWKGTRRRRKEERWKERLRKKHLKQLGLKQKLEAKIRERESRLAFKRAQQQAARRKETTKEREREAQKEEERQTKAAAKAARQREREHRKEERRRRWNAFKRKLFRKKSEEEKEAESQKQRETRRRKEAARQQREQKAAQRKAEQQKKKAEVKREQKEAHERWRQKTLKFLYTAKILRTEAEKLARRKQREEARRQRQEERRQKEEEQHRLELEEKRRKEAEVQGKALEERKHLEERQRKEAEMRRRGEEQQKQREVEERKQQAIEEERQRQQERQRIEKEKKNAEQKQREESQRREEERKKADEIHRREIEHKQQIVLEKKRKEEEERKRREVQRRKEAEDRKKQEEAERKAELERKRKLLEEKERLAEEREKKLQQELERKRKELETKKREAIQQKVLEQ